MIRIFSAYSRYECVTCQYSLRPISLVWGMKDPILGRALRRHERALPQAPVTRTQAVEGSSL